MCVQVGALASLVGAKGAELLVNLLLLCYAVNLVATIPLVRALAYSLNSNWRPAHFYLDLRVNSSVGSHPVCEPVLIGDIRQQRS